MYIDKRNKDLSVTRFDSLHEMLQAADANPFNVASPDWSGGSARDVSQAINAGRYTNDKDMRDARALLSKIDASFRDRTKQEWEPSVCGAYPIVPDYLMGIPDNMRERLDVEHDAAPLRVCLEVSYSSGVKHDAIMQRGTALAALIMRMSEERPIELVLFTGWKLSKHYDYCPLWSLKLDTNPINLQTLMDTVAGKGFARTINFSATNAIHKTVTGNSIVKAEPFYWAGDNKINRKEFLRETFGWDARDIVLERGYLDEADLMASDPVQWVHNQLEKQRALD
jgi:hypothetical protein